MKMVIIYKTPKQPQKIGKHKNAYNAELREQAVLILYNLLSPWPSHDSPSPSSGRFMGEGPRGPVPPCI